MSELGMPSSDPITPNVTLHNELREYLNSEKQKLKEPSSSDRVHKDECAYCFNTPFSRGGLFISLVDYTGLCYNHVAQYVSKIGCRLFLHIEKHTTNEDGEPKDKVQKLLESNEEKIETIYSLRFYPEIDQSLTLDVNIGDFLLKICDSVVAHVSDDAQKQVQSGLSDWRSDKIVPKGLEDLLQLASDGSVSYSGWECDEPGCGLKENLWLNLSDGSIKCGRYAPMSGLNGNSHAKIHYEKYGFPFVVKLGTIENEDGDVYSYADDDFVTDPWLRKHLAFFGLDIDRFKKTEKTTFEVELDANMKYEFSNIQEQGATLENVYGPGFTGLINLGSSCYMNSVLQIINLIPDFVEIYDKGAEKIFSIVDPSSSYQEFNFQLAKVIHWMCSGLYSTKDEEYKQQNGIRPVHFKQTAGAKHVEFSTARQQDAEEYIRYLFDLIDKSLIGHLNPVNSCRFQIETRFQDFASKKVRYTTREEFILSLPIPMHKAKQLPVVVSGASSTIEGVVRMIIPLAACIQAAFEDGFIEGYVSPDTHEASGALQNIRMATFPDFLLVQIQRFTYTNGIDVKKLDVDVEIDEEIDLSQYRSRGQQPGEELLPDEKSPNILQLMELGFSEHQAQYGLKQTRGDANAAAEWLCTYADEVPPPQPKGFETSQKDTAVKASRDGIGKYKLCGFISHMGSSPHSGHYVAHLNKLGQWYIYNDEKVAISQNPPKSLGYIYLYQRNETNV